MEKLHIRIEDHTAIVVRNALRDAIGLDTNQYRDCTDSDKVLWASSLNHHAQALHTFECAYQVAKKEREEESARAEAWEAEHSILGAVLTKEPEPRLPKIKPNKTRRVK